VAGYGAGEVKMEIKYTNGGPIVGSAVAYTYTYYDTTSNTQQLILVVGDAQFNLTPLTAELRERLTVAGEPGIEYNSRVSMSASSTPALGSAVKSGYGVCSGTVDYSLASHGLTANLEVEVPESEREALRALLDGCVTAPDPL